MLKDAVMAARVRVMLGLMSVPEALMDRLGFGVREVEDEPVSPQLRWFLRLANLEPVDVPHASKRAIFDLLGETSLAGPRIEVEVVDSLVPSAHPVPIRIYRPLGRSGPLPTIFWVHGGGFVIGSLASHDRFCRRLCQEAQVAVVAAHYRRGPEDPFPAPQEDVLAVWRWVRSQASAQGFDSQRLSLGGDSAGGNLTAMLCQQVPPEERPMFQVLCYPSVDLKNPTRSRQQWAQGYFLDASLIEWFNSRYCAGEDLGDPRISPLLNPTMADQPPAMVITAGMDPLTDEASAYADRLEATGVRVDRLHVAPMIHGFITLYGALPRADLATAEMIRRLAGHLNDG